jgi:hypothetical protein
MADAVPTAWSKQWEGPEDSRKWLRAIVSKRVALTQWAAKVYEFGCASPYLCQVCRPWRALTRTSANECRIVLA